MADAIDGDDAITGSRPARAALPPRATSASSGGIGWLLEPKAQALTAASLAR